MAWKLRTITDEELCRLVRECTSFRQIALKLGMSGGGTHASIKKRVELLGTSIAHFPGKGWCRGLTKDQHPGLASAGIKTSERLKGKTGRPQTKETRQKLSQKASGRSFGNNARVKWYEVLNPRTGMIKVQGTWECRYAEWLNQREIPWDRPITTFSWRRDESDIEHTYHPDFYLPETDTYIDVKGFMWKDDVKQIDDALKLFLVQEQNPHMRLQVLMKNDLKQMGVL